MDQGDDLEPTVAEMTQGLLELLSEGLVIAITGDEIKIFHKFSDRGLLPAYLAALLEELINRTLPAKGL